MMKFNRAVVALAAVIGCCLVAVEAQDPINVNLLVMNSMTRINEEGDRTTDVPHAYEMVVTSSLINFLNNGGRPIGRTSDYGCTVNLIPQFVDTVSDFSTALQQLNDIEAATTVPLSEFDVIVGPSRSSTCIPVSFVTSTFELPVFSPSCTSPELDDASAHRFFARTIPSDEAAGKAIVRLMEELPTGARQPLFVENSGSSTVKYSRVAVIYQEDTYGSNFKDAIFENSNDIDFELIPFIPGNKASLISAIAAAEATKLNVFVGIFFDEFFADFTEEAMKRGMLGPNKLWVFTDGIVSATDMLTALQPRFDEGEGVFADRRAVLEALDNSFLIQATGRTPSNQDNLDKFEDQLFKPEFGYDVAALTKLLEDLAEAPIGDLPLANFDDIIDTLDDAAEAKGFVTDFALFSYDVILAIREFIELENCEPNFGGINFMNIITGNQFEFTGVTGNVEFDPETGSRTEESSALKLLNARFNFNTQTSQDVQVAIFDDDLWTIDDSKILFTGGLKNAPRVTDPPEKVERNEFGGAVQTLLYVLASFEIIIVGGLLFFTYRMAHTNVIKAAQPPFLALMLIGVAIATIAVYLLPQDALKSEEDATASNNFRCNVPFYMVSFGLTMSYASLLFKLQRVVKVANTNPDLRENMADPVFGPFAYFALALALDVMIMLLIYNINPLQLEQRSLSTDEFGQPLETFDICVPQEASSSGIYSLFFLFHIAFYVYGFYLIAEVRNLSTDFQEGRWITLSIVSQFQLYLLGIPVVIAIGPESPDIRFLVMGMLVLLSNLVLLALIFGPKVWKIVKGDDKVIWKSRHNDTSGQNFQSGAPPRESNKKAMAVRNSLFHTMATNEFGFEPDEYQHSL